MGFEAGFYLKKDDKVYLNVGFLGNPGDEIDRFIHRFCENSLDQAELEITSTGIKHLLAVIKPVYKELTKLSDREIAEYQEDAYFSYPKKEKNFVDEVMAKVNDMLYEIDLGIDYDYYRIQNLYEVVSSIERLDILEDYDNSKLGLKLYYYGAD